MSCTLNSENFNGKTAGDAYLDEEWKCRSCHLLAGQHPPPPVQQFGIPPSSFILFYFIFFAFDEFCWMNSFYLIVHFMFRHTFQD